MKPAKKQSSRDRAKAEILARLDEWSKAKIPLQMERGNYCFLLRSVDPKVSDVTMIIRARQGKVYISEVKPKRPNKPKVDIILPPDFSRKTLMGEE